MKKKMKKLVLAKETLTRLVEADLMDVAGGTISANTPTITSCGARFCDDEGIGASC